MSLRHISATDNTEGTEMKQRRGATAHHLAGEEGWCVKRVILSVLFRVIPWQMRLSG
jgi:hypothetical protein